MEGSVVIREVPEDDGGVCTSISGALRYCKHRILYPYLKLLGLMGLKPCDQSGDTCKCCRILNKLWVLFVFLLITTGYGLQFLTCFRRDYGFNYKDVANSVGPFPNSEEPIFGTFNEPSQNSSKSVENSPIKSSQFRRRLEEPEPPVSVKERQLFHNMCGGNSFYVHLIPSLLHLLSFAYMLFLYWLNHDEQLQNLMERVFIQTTQVHVSQQKVLRALKVLVLYGAFWLLFSIGCLVFQILFSRIHVNFLEPLGSTELQILTSMLGFTTFLQDAMQVTIIVSYSIHCQLLSIYLQFVHSRISQHNITLQECIKEIGEIEKLLRYINSELASGILPLIMLDGMYCVGSLVVLVGAGRPPYTMLNACFSCILWTFLVALPLFQGARLNTCLKKVRELGHIVRMRPFGYQNYQQTDLDSFLLFVSTIKMDVRIMRLPLTATNISMLTFIILSIIFIWGYLQ